MIRTITFSLIVYLSSIIIGCKKNDTTTTPPIVTPLLAKTQLDVSYGTDVNQKMDIYLPANRSSDKTRTIILIHGGGWSGGDKADMAGSIPVVQQLWPEVAIININYRLVTATTNQHPTQLNDIATVINYLKTNKSTLAISDKFGLVGASAGAHLSLLYVVNNPTQTDVKVIADIFGPTNFMETSWTSMAGVNISIQNFLGVSLANNPAFWEQASPIYGIKSNFLPTIIFHGTIDETVPISQSDTLDKKLSLLGIPHNYTKYPGQGHGFTNATYAEVAYKIVDFFKQYL